ncbi:YkyA family protein [Lederbergia wuyishanensis]|uniref:DNA repair exonuclease SbcCD ATPase subunit n=1 Tax=Lederbergia wuyishanensis TaxID=1347903 RepID=A0ABU0CZC1_9BACI|nr:YkyA family protein [Lederbergia wuyishanensis]MCJ8006117.1 YkyA family protein [Lederbergia wuyishanensis]MDQ0341486.1 DNA repair exonuclease SbcCD ATPase subunit [Lederbergia wuyishanensis]
MRKIHTIIFVVLIAVVLTACTSSGDNIYKALEATAAKEADFENQQEPLKKLETSEKEIFDQIMELGMKEFDQISKLADNAIANLDQREEHLKKEKNSIEESKKEFHLATEEFKKIKDEKLKNQANELQELMNKRYESYDKLYSAYLNGLQEDRKIYEIIKNEDLKLEDLEAQIEASNKAYENVFEANQHFNEQTEKFNKAKLKFYEDSGLKIETK